MAQFNDPFLVINGYELPVQHEQGSQADDSTGYEQRSITGQLRREQIYTKRKWSFQTTWLELWEAQALALWLEGRGHHFGFEGSGNVYSDKGKGGWTGSITATYGPAAAKFGDYYANVSGSAILAFGYAAWTCAYWFWTGSAWQHRIQTSDGRQWQDGVPAVYAWGIGVNAAGTLSWGTGQYDDLVMLPFEGTDAQLDAWPLEVAYSAIPVLEASGLALGRSAYVEGTGTEIRQSQGYLDGAYAPLGQISFTLREV